MLAKGSLNEELHDRGKPLISLDHWVATEGRWARNIDRCGEKFAILLASRIGNDGALQVAKREGEVSWL